eukprot:gnl/TRDRNA2_/TRDRNA2_202438_c0_seq1.p1 gnl/TRDRNA2_/TRDRNA2_202438_c0~~gnl/TRDRNA2_/TRDRNA2_202438_c0_seq1.p1  ORF type:complete len:371 (+),score=44.26 gnl/TRDRNA2_/TRDRNA2_202438_c0_seq1:57-1169(+)
MSGRCSPNMPNMVATTPELLPKGDGVLSVMTFNILAPVWTNQSVYPGMDMDKFDAAARRTAQREWLVKMDADVVLMQECQKTELDALFTEGDGILKERYEHEFCPFPTTFWTNWLTDTTNFEPRENGVCVLTKRASMEKLKSDYVPIDLPEWSSKLPTYALGAKACMVWAKAKALGGANILIVTSHLDADSSYRAALQGSELAKKIHNLSSSSEIDEIIWGGDFNMEMRSMGAIQDTGFKQASAALRTPSVYTVMGTLRVDHILLHDSQEKRSKLAPIATFVPICPQGHTFNILPGITEMQFFVSSAKGERGLCLQLLAPFICLLLLPLIILVLCRAVLRQRACRRLSWALKEYGSDHLPVTVCLQREGA